MLVIPCEGTIDLPNHRAIRSFCYFWYDIRTMNLDYALPDFWTVIFPILSVGGTFFAIFLGIGILLLVTGNVFAVKSEKLQLATEATGKDIPDDDPRYEKMRKWDRKFDHFIMGASAFFFLMFGALVGSALFSAITYINVATGVAVDTASKEVKSLYGITLTEEQAGQIILEQEEGDWLEKDEDSTEKKPLPLLGEPVEISLPNGEPATVQILRYNNEFTLVYENPKEKDVSKLVEVQKVS